MRVLLLGAGLAVSAVLAARFGVPALRTRVSGFSSPGGRPPANGRLPRSPFVLCNFTPDGRAHFHPPKAELGQGAHTLLAQLFAEEAELDWDALVVHDVDTARGFDLAVMTSVGGTTADALAELMRRSGATLRELLRAEAARQLGVPLDEVVAERGVCFARGAPWRRLAYAELVRAKQGAWRVPRTSPALKEASAFVLLDRELPRVDARAKITGTATFTADVVLPGALHGAVARPPRDGARLRNANVAAAGAVPGVRAVVVQGNFAGVAADNRAAAREAVARLAATWEGGSAIGQAEIRARVTVPRGRGVIVGERGSIQDALKKGHLVEAQYRSHMVAPLPGEPPVALVDARMREVTVYSATQNPKLVRTSVAKALGRRRGRVRVIVPFVGGSFGRKHGFFADPAVEAALLSDAARAPVLVAYSTADDLAQGQKRPPTHHALRASLSNDGRVLGFEHEFASAEGGAVWPDLRAVMRATGVDVTAIFGAHVLYDGVTNHRTSYHRVRLPLRTGAFRALALPAQVFAVESFVDELAHAAKIDPLEFRLRHLGVSDMGRRLRAVLEAAARQAGWHNAKTPGRALGVACSAYGRVVAAQVAEVSVVKGGVRVHRVTCAVSAGNLVNPDVARAQVEGAVLMGLSWALREEVQVEDGAVRTLDLGAYGLLSCREAPDVDVIFLPGERSGGLNEMPAGIVAAAVSNAVFTLTGERLREMPLRPTTADGKRG